MAWSLNESVNMDWREIQGFGAGVGRTSDVWKFSVELEKWEKLETLGNNSDKPTKRDGHSLCDIGNGKVIIFGGQGEPSPNEKSERTLDIIKTKTWSIRDLYNDLFCYDIPSNTWEMLCPEGGVPLCRRGHSAMFLPRGAYGEPQCPIAGVPDTYGGGDDRSFAASLHSRSQLSLNQGSLGSLASAAPKMAPSKRSPHKRGKVDTGEEYLPVPENSMVVYGGSGMEVSKYIEAVYADVWVYSLENGRWCKWPTRGIAPKPLFDHRVIRAGAYMIVFGGITATNAKSKSGGTVQMTENHDVYCLNLQTCTWQAIDVKIAGDKPAKLNLHGHSVVPDGWEQGVFYLFGGKETVDGHRAALESVAGARKFMKRSNHGHAFRLDIKTGLLSHIDSRGPAPEARYEHLCATTAALGGGQLLTRQPPPKRKPEVREEPLMYIFGGGRVEDYGYCDPVLLALVRTYSYTNPDLVSLASRTNTQANTATQHNQGVGKAETQTVGSCLEDDHTISTQHTNDASAFAGMGTIGFDDEVDAAQPSIWEKKQLAKAVQHSQSMSRLALTGSLAMEGTQSQLGQDQGLSRGLPNSHSVGNLAASLYRDPSNWDELKLALTVGVTEKRSAHESPATANSAIADLMARSSISRASTGQAPVNAPASGTEGCAEGTEMALSAKAELKKRLKKLKLLGEQIMPLVKGKAYSQAKEDYFKKFPPPLPAQRTYKPGASFTH